MTAKFTLSLDQDIIIQAKAYALQTGRSLSELVENCFESLSNNEIKNSEISSACFGDDMTYSEID